MLLNRSVKLERRQRATDMKRLHCPINGWRNISEFVYGGEFHPVRPVSEYSDRQWAQKVFFHENRAGIVVEWWCHVPSAYWFLAERDTRSNEVLRTFDPGSPGEPEEQP